MSGKLTTISGAKKTKMSHHTPAASALDGSMLLIMKPPVTSAIEATMTNPASTGPKARPHSQKCDARDRQNRTTEISNYKFHDGVVGDRVTLALGDIQIKNDISKHMHPEQRRQSVRPISLSEPWDDIEPSQAAVDYDTDELNTYHGLRSCP